MRVIPIKRKYLFACVALALLLCTAQIMGSTKLVLGCLMAYILLVAWCCSLDMTMPMLLFFLPWSPIMRMSPESFSFYTFGMVLVCLLSAVKLRFSFRKYQIKGGLLLLFLSLLSKLLDGSGLSFDYIAFIMMIVLFPSVREEGRKQRYDFYQIVIFFSLGVILASLCAMRYAEYANIRNYIRVDAYQTIIRRSGFYGDANFYAAQILAALGGVLSLTLRERKRGRVVTLGITALFLLYSGFLSASKSFVLVSAVILLLWIMELLKMRGRAGLKVVLLTCFAWAAVYIATSAMFSGLVEVIITRFSSTRDLNSFTTGRIRIWKSYLAEVFGNVKVFLLGRGYTNIKIDGRASHNTVLQMVYQFGFLGFPVMMYWVVCFFQEVSQQSRRSKGFDLKTLMIAAGLFAPWLAIDALFFDEFFLFQMYLCVAMQGSDRNELAAAERMRDYNQHGGRL